MSTGYNVTNIRTLLTEGFTDEELRRLCYDVLDFRPVHNKLARGTGKEEIIDRLVEYAGQYLLFDTLLGLAQKHNPLRYAQHGPYYQEPRHVFISYKHHVEPDASLAAYLHQALSEAGHHVFIDQMIAVGMEWAAEIYRQIEACDFMVVLLSAASVSSEMVAEEVEHAAQCNRQSGKAHLLPVRVNYGEPLPYPLDSYLGKLQYAEWREQADHARLAQQLLDAITGIQNLPSPTLQPSLNFPANELSSPLPYADPRFVESLREPSGAVDLEESEFYIKRKGDELLHRQLVNSSGTTTTIRASRQTGKTSLLIRGLAEAEGNEARIIDVDLQATEKRYLESLDAFLRYLADLIILRLWLDSSRVDKAWQSSLGAPDKISYLLESYVLPEIDTRIVLAIDEADQLLPTSFHDTFFGLLRFWHNRRASKKLWKQLDIVMVISSEPQLLISNTNQSPFNVGLTIRLDDFDEAQVRDLNRRYYSPLLEADIPAFMESLGGHPYLTRKILYTMVTEQLTWAQLLPIIATDASPVGDHLRHYLLLILPYPELQEALKQIIFHGKCPDEEMYYRLSRAGLMTGPDRRTCRFRCRIYEEYLRDKLR